MSTIGTKKPCCEDSNNLYVIEERKGELIVRKCKVCGCRHFVVNGKKMLENAASISK